MRIRDVRFIQVFNLIKRYETLILSAKNEGLNVTMAGELLNEAKYALKLKQYETAVDFVKRAGAEVVKLKRQQEAEEAFKPENLEKKSKEELRRMCIEYDLDSIGLRSTLIDRLTDYYQNDVLPKKQAAAATQAAATPGTSPVSARQPQTGPGPAFGNQASVQTETATVEDTVSSTHASPGTVLTNISEVAGGLTIGYSYLIEEERVENSFKIFAHLIKDEAFTGLCFTRTNPRKLRDKFALENVQMMWLTDQDSEKETVVSPSLEGIIYIIEEFMDENQEGMVILDGLEYLLTNNKFNSVLRFLRQLVDNVSQTECILLVALSPDALDQTEVTLLEKDLLPVNYLS